MSKVASKPAQRAAPNAPKSLKPPKASKPGAAATAASAHAPASARVPAIAPTASAQAGTGGVTSNTDGTAGTEVAVLTLSSKNYSSWSLRGWLLARFASIEFRERIIPPDDPDMKAEILLLSPSILVPCLTHEGCKVWDTLAIAEYLHEIRPQAGLLPADRAARAHCRAICGEMHSGFAALRSALPMNLKARFPGFKVWARAQADIDRIVEIWRHCLATYGGPYLFGSLSMADAMYAPVVTRLQTYDVSVDEVCTQYCARILALPAMQEWRRAALAEPEEIDELDAEF